MTTDMQNKIAKIITENVLTPIIYMIETEDVLDFICFCDRNITMQEIYNTEKKIKDETGQTAEIIDIREFGEAERLEVIANATLIHSEHAMIEGIFAESLAEDYKLAMDSKLAALERLKETGTIYLQ